MPPPSPSSSPLPVALFALGTRLALLAWAAAAAALLPPYDTSGEAVTAPARAVDTRPWDAPVLAATRHLGHWDGQYYAHLASAPYDELQFYAFFPGLPLALAATRAVVGAPLVRLGLLSDAPATLVAGAVLSVGAFVAAAVALQHLTLLVTRSARAARLAALLFCVGPVGVFSIALYTESLFAALSFAGMAACEVAKAAARGGRTRAAYARLAGAAVAFAAAAATRSNGVLLGGHLALAAAHVWHAVHAGWWAHRGEGEAAAAQPAGSCGSRARRFAGRAAGWLVAVRLTVVGLAAVAAPAVLLQFHAYFAFCEPLQASVSQAGELGADAAPRARLHAAVRRALSVLAAAAGGRPLPTADAPPPPRWAAHAAGGLPWCSAYIGALRSGSWAARLTALPAPYAHVQATHWGVRPWAYFQWRHAPQFALAAPVLALAASAATAAAHRVSAAQLWGVVGAPLRALALPCLRPSPRSRGEGVGKEDGGEGGGAKPGAAPTGATPAGAPETAAAALHALRSPETAAAALPHVGHLAVLAVLAAVAMNVQVATRVLAAGCPALYWHAARLWLAAEVRAEGGGAGRSSARGLAPLPRDFRGWFLLWGVGYSLVGSALFAAFLPWT